MTALMTGEPMMVTEAVLETWCAAPTTVSSLVSTITQRTTAVRGRPHDPTFPRRPQLQQQEESGRSLLLGRSAAGGTIRAGGVVLQRVPVMLARATVTAPLTGELTMVTEAAGPGWSVAATTADSSGHTSMRRTTAVNSRAVEEVRLT